MRIELGDEQFADVLEPDELRSGDQDAVLAQLDLRQDPVTKQIIYPGDMSNRMRKALLCRIITSWNLQHPLPSKRPDSLNKLTLKQQRALFDGIAEHMKLIEEAVDDPTVEGSDPTEGSSSTGDS